MEFASSCHPLLLLGMPVAIGILYLLAEQYLHQRNLNNIPIRIHVNGSRGKTSVTRLIAAGLNAGGIRACAKTTGTAASFVTPDGAVQTIFRIGDANIIEQLKIVRWAVKQKSSALVIECMAIRPELQAICEEKIIQSTHGVLTNVEPDHLDVMGPDLKSVALTLANTIPFHGRFFTTEQVCLDASRSIAKERHTDFFQVSAAEINAVPDDEMRRFRYIEFKENVALALKVCLDCGVPRQLALQGMWKAVPDEGVSFEHHIRLHNRHIVFANAFAANDPVSTQRICDIVETKYPCIKNRLVIVNCREDRPHRTIQLARLTAFWTTIETIVVVGNGSALFQRHYHKTKPASQTRILAMRTQSAEHILDEMVSSLPPGDALILGIGNSTGMGMTIINYMKNSQANGAPLCC